MKIPQSLINLWKTEDNFRNSQFDLIVPISYSTRRDRLLEGTKRNACNAALIQKNFPQSEIVASNCSYTFPGAAAAEWEFKKALFTEYGTAAHRAEDMNNSVQEAQAIAQYVEKTKLAADRVLIVTGEMHSRSARWIWQRVMPNSKIFVYCVPQSFEYQPDHPVYVQRTAWKWFFANIARQMLLQVFGLDRIGRLHHRSEK